MIDKLGQKFRDTWPRRAGNQAAFDNFDNALRGVITARTGDHGKFAIEEAKRVLGNKMTVHERVVGTNPVDGSQWKTVDWPETTRKASANIVDIVAHYKSQYTDPESSNAVAREHRQIILSWKEAEKVSQRCRL